MNEKPIFLVLSEEDKELWREATNHCAILELERQSILRFVNSFFSRKFNIEGKSLEYLLEHGTIRVEGPTPCKEVRKLELHK